MIVPQFWAEARVHRPRAQGQPQITVRRFGWSDTSQADAEDSAQQRAQAAFDRIASGAKLPRREPKIPYNGAKGVPIREEIISRHGDVVVTRNSYGAHCLNTPNVLFADIDFHQDVRPRAVVLSAIILIVGALAAGDSLDSGKLAALFVLLALILAYPVAALLMKTWISARGGPERLARSRLSTFLKAHPNWNVRLYRTPSGLRVLAMHDVFDPESPGVSSCFSALGVDRVYAAMCRNQHCFRARLSPKPWRIGISAHMRPRPGVWPVRPEQRDKRNSWIRHYEAKRKSYASCRFVEALGSGVVHPKAESVRMLHDRLSQALTSHEIA